MKNNYYTLPLNTANFITNKPHTICGINKSIAHHIHLVTTSYFGECSFDETYGCSFWNVDFDNLKSPNVIKGLILESLGTSLRKHEKRLSNIKISVKVKQEELESNLESNRMKKRIDIGINGKVNKTNEDFSYFEYFYLGPLSY